MKRNRFVQLLLDAGNAPILVAHRGASALAPENVLEAGRLAKNVGAHAWEVDVQLTRDGVPVLLHDDTLERTTDVVARFVDDPRGREGYRLADFDFEEVRSLDVGRWFVASNVDRSAAFFGSASRITPETRDRAMRGEIRVPTLNKCLELTRDEDWLVNIELKALPRCDARLIDAVLQCVRRLDMTDRVLLSSFDHRLLVDVREREPGAATGVLTDVPLLEPQRYVVEAAGATCYIPSADCLGSGSDRYRRTPSSETLDRATIAGLRVRGVPTLVYTVNDPALAAHLGASGAAGIITDDPERLRGGCNRPDPRA